MKNCLNGIYNLCLWYSNGRSFARGWLEPWISCLLEAPGSCGRRSCGLQSMQPKDGRNYRKILTRFSTQIPHNNLALPSKTHHFIQHTKKHTNQIINSCEYRKKHNCQRRSYLFFFVFCAQSSQEVCGTLQEEGWQWWLQFTSTTQAGGRGGTPRVRKIHKPAQPSNQTTQCLKLSKGIAVCKLCIASARSNMGF